MNILIVKLSAIGDVIHTLPAANVLRERYPGAHITWLVEEAASSLVIGHPALDRTLVSRRKSWIARLRSGPFNRRLETLREIREFIGQLRDRTYDWIIDFQALLKSGILIAFTRGQYKVGFDKGMEHMEHSHIFLNRRIPPIDMDIHALTRGLILLDAIGVRTKSIEYRLPVGSAEREKARKLLDLDAQNPREFVAINPMAKWDTKLWEDKKFAELADRIIENHHRKVVFTGGGEDRVVIERILSRMRHKALNLSGKTDLKTLAAVYEHMDILITTDTGPMHLGAAVGIPVVALFGPTSSRRTGPFGGKHIVISADPPCRPCFKRRCDTKNCMKNISVDTVYHAAENILLRLQEQGPI